MRVLSWYQKFLSPILEYIFGHACRFTPTCSEYTRQAINKYGMITGLARGISRIIRCNPLSKPGYDPV